MTKIPIGPQSLIFPKPAFLVGADVGDKPNFLTVAWGGIANGNPPMITVTIRKQQYTLKGILANSTFSVNIPSVAMVKETDYCGLFSGSKVDKVEVCKFKVFYGKLGSAPLIEQCPVNLECQVTQLLDFGSHTLVLGTIVETFVSEDCFTDGKPDVYKIAPLIYSGSPARDYLALGEVVAKAYKVGQELAREE